MKLSTIFIYCSILLDSTKALFDNNALKQSSLENVHLPDDFTEAEIFNNFKKVTVTSTIDLIKLVNGLKPITKELDGKSKNDSDSERIFLSAQNIVIKLVASNNGHLLPKDYQYFGTSNVENLQLLLQNNPFYASTLTSTSAGTFALRINDPKKLYSKFISTLDKSYPRLDAAFNSNLELISYQYLDYESNAPIAASSKGQEEAAGDLQFLLFFYAECVHSTMHIFHYIHVNALWAATKEFPELTLWADPYMRNVGPKYVEVNDLLLAPDNKGALTGGMWRTDGDKVRAIQREMLCRWGSFKTAEQFTDEFIFYGLEHGAARKAGIAPEYFKHMDLIAPFAQDLSEAFSQSNPQKYAAANRALGIFVSQCGDGVSSIGDIRTWLELMTVTGLLHGSTLSFTRLGVAPEVVKRMNPTEDHYTSVNTGLLVTAAGTLVGIVEDRHIFTSSLYTQTADPTAVGRLPQSLGDILVLFLSPAEFLEVANAVFQLGTQTYRPLDALAKDVLLRYDAKSARLKKDFFDRVSKDPKFATQGWVLSDHFPDGIDGKQLTITTYI